MKLPPAPKGTREATRLVTDGRDPLGVAAAVRLDGYGLKKQSGRIPFCESNYGILQYPSAPNIHSNGGVQYRFK
jgi:hypothetical protein